jgi:hypothetical protein
MDSYSDTEPQIGRPTIDDDLLSTNRDSLANLLCCWWPEIGSQLTTATTREALIGALQPVKDHANRHLLSRLLRPTTAHATGREIRGKRKDHEKLVEERSGQQAYSEKCFKACRQIDLALMQPRPEDAEFIFDELSRRRTECQQARDRVRAAEKEEHDLERQLLDMEAAFAQDELLEFIVKAKYSLDPLKVANAMAGLPFALGVPFLTVWTSYSRCSQLSCPMWPSWHYEEFKAIESMWKESELFPATRLNVFENEIRSLPKTVLQTHPTLGSIRVENYVRTHLSEKWWYLQRAIEASIKALDDPRPMAFKICSTLNKLLSSPNPAEEVRAEAARIR